MEIPKPDKQILIDIVTVKMPFGKYQGWLICDLPEAYLLWFKNKSFPKGRLGFLMENAFEIRLSGLSPLLKQVKEIQHRNA